MTCPPARLALASLAALLTLTAPASAQVITGAVRTGTPDRMQPVIVAGGLNPGVAAFNDRVHVYFEDGANPFPTFLRGLDFLRVNNDDRNVADYTLNVTVNQPATMYLLIDNRVGDGSGANPPDLTTVMNWVTTSGFTSTGSQIAFDEGNDGTINQFYTVFSRQVPAGSITLRELNDPAAPTGRNMYAVAAAPVPEPTTLVLTGLGGLGLAWRARRRARK